MFKIRFYTFSGMFKEELILDTLEKINYAYKWYIELKPKYPRPTVWELVNDDWQRIEGY